MQTVEKFERSSDFWMGIIVPDYNDFQTDQGDLRKALHLAISLFRNHDWVFVDHSSSIVGALNSVSANGVLIQVSDSRTFANWLESQCGDFSLIRGIANAAKHLQLSNIRPHVDAPSHSANTASQIVSFGQGSYGVGPYGGGSQVMLEGATGHRQFSQIANSVFQMWGGLKQAHGW